MTLMISIDREWGGFYIVNGFMKSIGLGFIAFTLMPISEMKLFKAAHLYLDHIENEERVTK